MDKPSMRSLFLILLAATALPLPASAQRWTLRGQALDFDYRETGSSSAISGTSFLELEGGSGLQASAEYRRSRRIGWEVAAAQLDLDTTAGFTRLVPISLDPLVLEPQTTLTGRGTLRLRPLTGALLVHPPVGERLDLYLGPLLGVTFFSVGDEADDRDPELTYGGKLGAELRLGDGRWGVGLEVRHLQIDHESTERDLHRDIGLQTVGFGVSYRLGAGSR
jgi:hypothetical protein